MLITRVQRDVPRDIEIEMINGKYCHRSLEQGYLYTNTSIQPEIIRTWALMSAFVVYGQLNKSRLYMYVLKVNINSFYLKM